MQPKRRAASSMYPVFVFPSNINFYLDEPTSLKQVVTLYNPYDIGISFKVYSNRPSNYRVVDPVGSVKPKCCIDVVVRHGCPAVELLNITDKFRIDICQLGHKQLIGRTYVPAVLLPGRSPVDDAGEFMESASAGTGVHSSSESPDPRAPSHGPQSRTIRGAWPSSSGDAVSPDSSTAEGMRGVSAGGAGSPLLVAAAVCCVLALLLPMAAEPPVTDSLLPPLLHLSSQLKMAFAYGLGLLTMALLRPV